MIDTTYGSKTVGYFEDRRLEMVEFIPTSARSMLEIGCGNAAFAAHLKTLRKINVTAIESHPAAADVASGRVDRLVRASIEDGLPQLADEQFDCIVLNDVLEHLLDPWRTVASLRPCLQTGGVVIASIPNMRYLPVFKQLVLRGHWEYAQDGVMDRTHLRFFTRQTMRHLFESTGYQVQSIQGINGIELPWRAALLNRLASRRFDDTRYKQFACVAA